MQHTDPCFTPFQADVSDISLPERFTFPFCYEPHPLAEMASSELQHHLTTQTDWYHPFGLDQQGPDEHGKMFGVLVVQTRSGQLGYLSAFSGQLAEQNHLPGFVPPVFDRFAEDAFFRTQADHIAALNQQVKALSSATRREQLKTTLKQRQTQAEAEIETLRQSMIASRAQRKAARAAAQHQWPAAKLPQLLMDLGKESVAEKNRLKQLKRQWDSEIHALQAELESLNLQIDAIKAQRQRLSARLQTQLFAQYRFLNRLGEQKSLNAIFAAHTNPVPPAGSGECAAPKLLQYAFLHHFKPIALAEFWWGCSPKSEVRQHKKFYPACQSKCQPILGHMLQGMPLEENPLLSNPAEGKEIDILFQDDAIVVVNKPAEFLSVPGVNIKDSVLTRLEKQFPDVEGPFVLHRLDMSTSGLLVFALTRRANKSLQKQFIGRDIEKRYVALLSGELTVATKGEIHLPLRGDLNDRPRQMVCYEHGKPAETHWQVIATENGQTRVHVYPLTGRTHQLRVHCAHHQGLNLAIVGDDLYGRKANRLHLHAESLSFDHPYTKQRMTFQVTADF